MIKPQNNNLLSAQKQDGGLKMQMPTKGHLLFRRKLFKQGFCRSIESTIVYHQRRYQLPRTYGMHLQEQILQLL